MANPQKENGFTPIANEIIEQLVKASLLGSEYQLVFFVIRKTYGYHKKQDRIALSQFELGTGLSRPTVVKSLKNLVLKKVLLRSENLLYSLNKDYEKWLVNTPLLVKSNSNIGKHALTKIGKDALTHKRKKDMTKDNSELHSQEIPILIKSFESINPACKRFYGNTTQRNACIDLIEVYTFDRVKNVIEKTLPKTNGMDFMPTITTPLQLFTKWATLESGIKRYQSKSKKLLDNVAF